MCLGAILWARARAVYFAATRVQAAQAGFDDAVFYQALAGDNAVPLVREQVEHADGNTPFAVYARLPGTIRY
jgi:guanine deaminase